jgi:hypothetical protein
MRRIRTASPLVLAVLLAAAGCGGSDQSTVKGQVTLDGAPVENGHITFYSTAADGAKAAAAIQNGEYAVPAGHGLTPGSYKVEVSWLKPTGKKVPSADPGFTIDETREAIPRKYNADTTLTVDVGPGETVRNFPLTSD